MATNNMTYTNLNKQNANKVDNSNRFKVNQQVLNMIARNPSLGIGYIIGSALGENYWGRKRNKRAQQAHNYGMNGRDGIGADENGVYGVNNSNGAVKYQGRPDVDWGAYNKALDSVPQNNKGVYIDTAKGIYPRTPAQANKPAVTLENVGNGGGVPSVADAWNKMANGSTYNPGGTTLYTGGVRNLGNVIGADENGVYGVGGAGSAPSVANFPTKPANGPAPYTDDQLRQIAAQNFTPEELSRMATQDELARMNALTQPAQGQEQTDDGGGLLSSVTNAVAGAIQNGATTPAQPALPQGNVVAPSNMGEFNDAMRGYVQPDGAPNLAVLNTPQQTQGGIGIRYVADPNNPSFLDKYLGNGTGIGLRYVKDPKNPSFLDKWFG